MSKSTIEDVPVWVKLTPPYWGWKLVEFSMRKGYEDSLYESMAAEVIDGYFLVPEYAKNHLYPDGNASDLASDFCRSKFGYVAVDLMTPTQNMIYHAKTPPLQAFKCAKK